MNLWILCAPPLTQTKCLALSRTQLKKKKSPGTVEEGSSLGWRTTLGVMKKKLEVVRVEKRERGWRRQEQSRTLPWKGTQTQSLQVEADMTFSYRGNKKLECLSFKVLPVCRV